MTSSTTAPDERLRNALTDELPFACDLVMKGGITSGVVYPTAIAELARDHRLHNIGGASAGAIAAAAAAAAEYGRQTGGEGFDALEALPGELAKAEGGKTLLQRLFVPQTETAECFNLIFEQRSLGKVGVFKRLRKLMPSFLRHSAKMPDTRIGKLGSMGLPLGGLGWLVAAPSAATICVAALAGLGGLATYLGGRIVTGGRNLIDDVQTQLANNMHGLVNGNSVDEQIGLTEWLHLQIERLAGPVRADGSDRPLTYEDLGSQDIGLVTLTTNLSQGSSENFPFSDETWAFSPNDMRKLLPETVANYLIAEGTANTDPESRSADQLESQGLVRLPAADKLPVILGARVSLSFPVLLSAVPLWRFGPVRHSDGTWRMEYKEVWLSDGGICSNMPVHLFDGPLPSRPTYGISLGSGATSDNPGLSDEATALRYAHQNVWRPIRAGSGAGAPVGEISSTTKLLAEVFNTMQNWSDNSMTRALGVRDRLCTVKLADYEGGMNLDMDSNTILGLAPRGQAAGENLGWMVRGDTPEHMDPPNEDQEDEAATQWTRHRWTRLRSSMLGLDAYLSGISDEWEEADDVVPQGGEYANTKTYSQLAAEAHDLDYLPYQSSWTSDAGTELEVALDRASSIKFDVSSTQSPPPFRRLALSSRGEPETEFDE